MLLASLAHMLPLIGCWVLLNSSNSFHAVGFVNGACQFVLYGLVVCLPTWRTGIMAYADIGWSWGLVIIGMLNLFYHDGEGLHSLRSAIVSMTYIFAGGRMGLAMLSMWTRGVFQVEVPRYAYHKQYWKEKGVSHMHLAMQLEILLQPLANASFLALPAFLVASNDSSTVSFKNIFHWHTWIFFKFTILSVWRLGYSSCKHFSLQRLSIHVISLQVSAGELIGIAIWIGAFIMESVADVQKIKFSKKMKLLGKQNSVCNVGLWRYCRHPNYFAEWMVWNALVIAALPSWFALRHHVSVHHRIECCEIPLKDPLMCEEFCQKGNFSENLTAYCPF